MEETKKKSSGRPKASVNKAQGQTVVAAAPVAKSQPSAVRKQFDKNEDIAVISQFPGELHYVSKRTGYETVWAEVGAVEYLPYEELMSMANAQRKFFVRNWISVGDDVLFALRMDKYYVNSLTFEEYESVFDLPIEKMAKKLANIPDGQKKTLIYRARVLISEGQIDSKKRIVAIEEALGVSFGE